MRNLPTYNELSVKPTGVVFMIEVVVSPTCGVDETVEELTDLIRGNLDHEVIACEVTDIKMVTNDNAELRKITAQRAYKE